jgi:hypothetical protein
MRKSSNALRAPLALAARGVCLTLLAWGCGVESPASGSSGDDASPTSGTGGQTTGAPVDAATGSGDADDAPAGGTRASDAASGGIQPAADAGAACDPTPVLAACLGCHGPQRAEGGLDLSPEDLPARLVGVPSTRCPTELRVDPLDPERSMLLVVSDAARHATAGYGTAGACAVGLMPPGSQGLPPADVACLSSWVRQISTTRPTPPPMFEAASVESALAKVKTLLTGGAPTGEERSRALADPAAMRALVTEWTATPAFEAKLLAFLRTALHQDLLGTLDDQLDKPRGRPTRLKLLETNVADAFARTALRLVLAGEPFTAIATTREWELTTALALALAYADQDAAERSVEHTLTRTAPADAPDPPTVEYMVEHRTWVEPSVPADCRLLPRQPAERLLDFFLGLVRCGGDGPDYRFDNPLLLPSDFTDWRTVRLVNTTPQRPATRFYDLPALRGADTLPLDIRRAGFFTSPAFLANYPTNPDNQFRVTTNQALIVALQSTFNAADPTEPFESDALDLAHAVPGTACHGCHKLLDPMRVALWDTFSPTYQHAEETTGFEGRFAFQGTRRAEPVETLVEFGRALAAHPRFATAWVQRLCYWANAQACDEADPRFRQIADAFESGGFDFRTMLIDLFASPLVTGVEVPAPGAPAPRVSITRANHLCPLLAERLALPDICRELGTSVGLVPKDEFARGDTVPAMTDTPSTFSFAAAEAMCTRLSARLVGDAASGRRLRTDDVPGALDLLVVQLMGLPPGHPRHATTRAALQAHFDEVRAAPDGSNFTALRSTALVACLSPDVMGVGL